MIDERVLASARDNLQNRISAINHAQFGDVIQRNIPLQRISAGLDPREIRTWITPLLGQVDCAALYRLTVDSQAGADRLRRAFEEYEPPEGVMLTRNNMVNDSQTVYVGSSRSIGQRLSQHLCTAADRTYALKMNLWCPDTENELNVEVTVVRGAAAPSLVQDVEDALWTRSRPMFGKFGTK